MAGPNNADDDDTILIPRNQGQRRPTRRRRLIAVFALMTVLGLGGFAAWHFLRSPPAPVAQAPVFEPPARTVATEADILAHRADRLTVFRFAANPRVLVLDFPTLLEQGQMLNRVAVFLEEVGAPHDRALDDAALDEAIRRIGLTAETFYYGHDYRAADIARFFANADRDGISLDAEEGRLRELAREEGWLNSGAIGALISVPREGADAFVDASVRAVILHHELSHGEYFTNPAYADYARAFWANGLGDDDRSHFRRFLESQDYDTGIDDLMINETQAYLMHTPDARFFSARDVGLPVQRLDALRAAFLVGMPGGWLRDCTPGPTASQRLRLRARASAAWSPGSRRRRRVRRACAPPRSRRAEPAGSRPPVARRRDAFG